MTYIFKLLEKKLFLTYLGILDFVLRNNIKNHNIIDPLIGIHNNYNFLDSNISDSGAWDIISDIILIQNKYENWLREYYTEILSFLIMSTKKFFDRKIEYISKHLVLGNDDLKNAIIEESYIYYTRNGDRFLNNRKMQNLLDNLILLKFKYLEKSLKNKRLLVKHANTIVFVKNLRKGRLKESINLVAESFLNELKKNKTLIIQLDYFELSHYFNNKVINNVLETFDTTQANFILSWLIEDIEKFDRNNNKKYDPFYNRVIKKPKGKNNGVESGLLNKYISNVNVFNENMIFGKISDDFKSTFKTATDYKLHLSIIYSCGDLNYFNCKNSYDLYNRKININEVNNLREIRKNKSKKFEEFFAKIFKYHNSLLKKSSKIEKKLFLYYDIIKFKDYVEINLFTKYVKIFKQINNNLNLNIQSLKKNFKNKIRKFYKNKEKDKSIVSHKYNITKEYFEENKEFYCNILKTIDFLQYTMLDYIKKVSFCIESKFNIDILKLDKSLGEFYIKRRIYRMIREFYGNISIFLKEIKIICSEVNSDFYDCIQNFQYQDYKSRVKRKYNLMNKYLNLIEIDAEKITKIKKIYRNIIIRPIKKLKINKNSKILVDLKNFFSSCEKVKDVNGNVWNETLYYLFMCPKPYSLEKLYNKLQEIYD